FILSFNSLLPFICSFQSLGKSKGFKSFGLCFSLGLSYSVFTSCGVRVPKYFFHCPNSSAALIRFCALLPQSSGKSFKFHSFHFFKISASSSVRRFARRL